MTTPDLDDTKCATLVALLRAEIENTRYPLSPRIRKLRAILYKLAPLPPRPEPDPAPKPPREPSHVSPSPR
jgi:hypothetical protein